MNRVILVTRFTLAVNRKTKDEADFINCVAFSKTAECVDKYFKQGTKIVVEGRWQTGSYTNKNGQKVYTNECYVESVEFGESKKDSGPQENEDFVDIPQEFLDDSHLPFN